ncbi:MAG: hypothetical protein HZB19_08540 [Chloroflexi bacterium]|nr:hypothetical protein [Chloroflexota bacterium]
MRTVRYVAVKIMSEIPIEISFTSGLIAIGTLLLDGALAMAGTTLKTFDRWIKPKDHPRTQLCAGKGFWVERFKAKYFSKPTGRVKILPGRKS